MPARKNRGVGKLALLLVMAALVTGGYILIARLGWMARQGQDLLERLPVVSLPGLEPRVASALQGAERSVRKQPGSARAWRDLGATYDAHRLPKQAEACYLASLELEPDDFWTRYQYAVMREMLEREEHETIALFVAIEAERSKLPQVALRIGGLFEKLGELDQALKAYSRAVRVAPGFAMAQRTLGQALLAKGEPAEALKHLEQARFASPSRDGPTFAALAQAYNLLGQTEAAEQAAREAELHGATLVLLDPMRMKVTFLGTDSRTCFERAKFLMKDHDFNRALKDLLIAAENMQTNPYLHLRMATCYSELKREALAAQHQDRVLELRAQEAEHQNPDLPADDLVALDAVISRYRMKYESPSAELEPFAARVALLVTQGELQAIIEELERAEAATDLTPRLRLLWARSAHKLEDDYQTLIQLDQLLLTDPGNLAGHLLQGKVFEAMGRRTPALKSYRRVLRLSPRHPVAKKVAELGGP